MRLVLRALGLLFSLLGLTSLVDSIVTWKEWFEQGILVHYETVRDHLFALLRLNIPEWLQDAAVLWSAFSFWSGSAMLHSERDTPSTIFKHIRIFVLSVLGPAGLLFVIFGIARHSLRAVSVSNELAEARPLHKALLRRKMIDINEALIASGAGIFYGALWLAVGMIGLLFVAGDAFEKLFS